MQFFEKEISASNFLTNQSIFLNQEPELCINSEDLSNVFR